MFERRLKILLFLFLLAAGALALRAAQIQILDHNHWRSQAVELMKKAELIETTRGTIFDCKGLQLAFDAPCVDASVDYRAITETPDPDWIEKLATQNLKDRFGKDISHSSNWESLRDNECDKLRGDIADMWTELAVVGDKSPDEIDEIRRDIVSRVEMRKRYIWWRNYEKAEGHGNSTSWYRQFLGDSAPDESDIDKFEVEVGEETTPHVILHNISPDIQARLAREQSRFFCLSLVPSKFRKYAFGRVGCNVLGYIDTVGPGEVAADADLSDAQAQQYWTDQARKYWTDDLLDHAGFATFRELRKYWPTDLAGREGIESLCENTLRGTRGKIERVSGTDQIVDQIDARPGRNVSLSIDIQLQQDIESEFAKTRVHRDTAGNIVDTRFNQHGAAVVLDVTTNKVLALVSCPGFDPNDLATHYDDWAKDELNRPLLDRATELAVVPGSSVKPIVGSGAITDGVMTSRDKIQCRGELFIDGKPQPYGHCWIFAQCKAAGRPISHHAAGDSDIGPDDMLTISDGLKDSCNVVFENVALRMGMSKLSSWFDRFGLGRPTGIGIEESPGLIYRPSPDMMVLAQTQTWSAGIGEGHIQATPIQMANVAATIARNGMWMRPRLIDDEDASRFTTRPSIPSGPDVVDLHLSPDALQAVQKGMCEVCSDEGTGRNILPKYIDRGPNDPPLEQDPLLNIPIAGKTGSAQTQQLLTLVNRNADGKVTLTRVHFGDPGTEGWYLRPDVPESDPQPEKHLAHGWFIGYAPADHPRIAFCVFVEYGEAGGRVAGGIAHDLLVDCMKHGYLSAAK